MSIESHAQSLPTAEKTSDNSDLLTGLYAAIDIKFAEKWDELQWPSYYDPDEIAERRAKLLQSEYGFAKDVVAAALDAAPTTDGPVTLLFDVDETIVKQEFDRNDNTDDIVRPAFPVVIDALRHTLGENKLEVGLLTSRGQSHLDEELQHPTYLADVIDAVNGQFVISSRDSHYVTDRHADNNHTALRNNLGDFLNQDLITEDEWETQDHLEEVIGMRVSWKGSKLPILKTLAEEYRDHRSFVYVDDALSASVINPKAAPNLRAVQLDRDTAFWGLR